jgi:hypothetical protein
LNLVALLKNNNFFYVCKAFVSGLCVRTKSVDVFLFVVLVSVVHIVGLLLFCLLFCELVKV